MVELLSPVRDEVSFRAAVNAGADAVYFGLGSLNMRVNSRGIDIDSLPEIVRHAHKYNVKIYVTLNAIVYGEEIEMVDDLLAKCKKFGVDAVICWDPAVIELCRKHQLEIHISTQASVSNHFAANHYKAIGAERIVPARELTLDQITQLKNNTDIELEVFIHGAMCVSVSGRCFMSQFVHGRSANRGDCLQPCREHFSVTSTENQYDLTLGDGYVMSPKDLCALPILDKVIATGVDSLKIEGRSRSPEYIRMVVSVYRRAIDAIAAGTFGEELVNELMENLKRVYNRGFSTGFLFGKPAFTSWADRRNSQATEKKEYVGKMLNFYRKTNIAHCKIEALDLAVGDKIQVHGFKTGVIEMIIKEMRNEDGTDISHISRGNITFPSEHILRDSDLIYKIIPVVSD